jgi:hypothetical protein
MKEGKIWENIKMKHMPLWVAIWSVLLIREARECQDGSRMAVVFLGLWTCDDDGRPVCSDRRVIGKEPLSSDFTTPLPTTQFGISRFSNRK